MKLNNRGFAISTIMYMILVMAIVLITLTLSILSTRKLILDKIRKETNDTIYDVSNQGINYCKSESIHSFKECLIRNDSKQELADALNTINTRTSTVDFSAIEPINVFSPDTSYTNITNKTDKTGLTSTKSTSFRYVTESKLINPFDISDTDITKISFDTTTGNYTYTNSVTGNINDIVTTQADIENNIYKYTCLNTTSNGNCTTLYLFTEAPYLISGTYYFKQGYKYTYKVLSAPNSNSGLYKGEDDYTIDSNTYTYYYRGDVDNNWVKFGGFLWRIIRINGDGSIRMIYSGLASSSNHTGDNAQIGTSEYGDNTTFTTTTQDISGLTSDTITTKYTNRSVGNTSVGYMRNFLKQISTYPDKTPGNTTDTRLNYFPTYTNITSSTKYYFFKNFDKNTDCFKASNSNESGACTLKCRSLGNDGDSDIDCVYSDWNTLATNHYSTTAAGVYPATNPTQYIYTGDYKYSCLATGTAVKKTNSDGTTSVYITCAIVKEMIGTVKDKTASAKVKYHGLFFTDMASSNENVKNSKVKTEIDNWYSSNILGKRDTDNNLLENYLSDEIFCNDRSSISNAFPLTTKSGNYLYKSYTRNNTNKTPSFKCLDNDGNLNTNDSFTLKEENTESIVESSGIGNKKLDYPVGLITGDEVAFAGGVYAATNYKYYLYTGSAYWTMSPYYVPAANFLAYMHIVDETGKFITNYTSSSYGMRPVINLRSDVLYYGGLGTERNPYIVGLPEE